jgi:hypothetical protein
MTVKQISEWGIEDGRSESGSLDNSSPVSHTHNVNIPTQRAVCVLMCTAQGCVKWCVMRHTEGNQEVFGIDDDSKLGPWAAQAPAPRLALIAKTFVL